MTFNRRENADVDSIRRRVSILVGFPDDPWEAIAVQWDKLPPTVFLQLKHDPNEPLQFPGRRPSVPGNAELPPETRNLLDYPLQKFIDPCSGQMFEHQAWKADILMSVRGFELIQPEPGQVLPPDSMWQCRLEALRALGIPDEPGLEIVQRSSG